MKVISNLADILKFFQENKDIHIYGIGISNFNRAFFDSQRIPTYIALTLNENVESNFIKRYIKTYSVESFLGEDVNKLKDNGTEVIKNKNIYEILKSTSNNYLIPYKGRPEFEEICSKERWISAVGSSSFGKSLLEDKIKFRELFSNKVTFPDFEIIEFEKLSYKNLLERFGKKFVIQYPFSSGGKETFIIKNKEKYFSSIEKLKKVVKKKGTNKILVSRFVSGIPASVSCVATRWGTFCSNIQFQLQDIDIISSKNKGSGRFNGHDWTSSQIISEKLNNKVIEEAKNIGDEAYKKGYRGFFGLDIMVDTKEDKFYMIECNPRLTGALPVLEMIQEDKNKPGFIMIHLLEFIAENKQDIQLDYSSLQKELVEPKEGVHFIICSKKNKKTRFEIKIRPGVYKFDKNGNLEYQREGYRIKDINNYKEFILTEFISSKSDVKDYGRIARVIMKHFALTKNSLKFNKFASQIAKAFYKNVEEIK